MRYADRSIENYEELICWDRKHLWHPYTQHKEYASIDPIYIVRAKGIYLYDIKGNVYYDTISSWWCNILGHGRKDLVKAITDQANSLDHTLFSGIVHRPAIELTQEISRFLPPHLTRFFFSDNGSTAVEIAIKMAFQYWKMRGERRNLFLFLENSYHGDTIGAMSVSGTSQFNSYFKELFFKSRSVPSPADDWERSLERIEAILKKSASSVCAIIIEPLVQCAGGMRIYPIEFLNGLEMLRKKHKFFLICDEIAVGLGRLGKFLGCQNSVLKPDFVCLSKALTNGMLPLALTITTEKVFRAFLGNYSTHTFFHGHTYTANPIACRVATETIKLLNTGPYIGRVKGIEARLRKFAEEIENKVSRIKHSQALGVIWRAEVAQSSRKEMFTLYLNGLKNGVILRPLGNVVYLFLPLVVGKRELEDILERTYESITETI